MKQVAKSRIEFQETEKLNEMFHKSGLINKSQKLVISEGEFGEFTVFIKTGEYKEIVLKGGSSKVTLELIKTQISALKRTVADAEKVSSLFDEYVSTMGHENEFLLPMRTLIQENENNDVFIKALDRVLANPSEEDGYEVERSERVRTIKMIYKMANLSLGKKEELLKVVTYGDYVKYPAEKIGDYDNRRDEVIREVAELLGTTPDKIRKVNPIKKVFTCKKTGILMALPSDYFPEGANLEMDYDCITRDPNKEVWDSLESDFVTYEGKAYNFVTYEGKAYIFVTYEGKAYILMVQMGEDSGLWTK